MLNVVLVCHTVILNLILSHRQTMFENLGTFGTTNKQNFKKSCLKMH